VLIQLLLRAKYLWRWLIWTPCYFAHNGLTFRQLPLPGWTSRSSNSERTRFNNDRHLGERERLCWWQKGEELRPVLTPPVEDRITDDVARHPVRASRRTPRTFDCLVTPKQLLSKGTVLILAPAAIPFLLAVVPFTDEAEITPDGMIKFNKRNFCQMSIHMELLGRETKTIFKKYTSMQTAGTLIGPFGFWYRLTGITYHGSFSRTYPQLLESVPLRTTSTAARQCPTTDNILHFVLAFSQHTF